MRSEQDDMRRQLTAAFKYEQERNAIKRASMQQHIDELQAGKDELQERLAAEQTKSQLLAQALDEADGLEFIDKVDEHQNGDDNFEQATDDGDTNGAFDA